MPDARPTRLAVVIGAMRCGTTTLFQLLQQAPSVCLTRIKEPDYFIDQKSFYRGPSWYSSLFTAPEKVCVDISPNYAKNDIFPGVAEKINEYNSRTKLIYVVRDPVKRAVSEYHHQRAAGVVLPSPGDLLDSPDGAHIVNNSRYGHQIADYLRVFDAGQILIVDMDDLISDPQKTVTDMLVFCGDQSTIPPLTIGVENDRGSVERLPRFWLALRRTRLGDRIRDLVPPGMHKQLKALGTRLLGRKPAPQAAGADFDEATLARLTSLLKPDADHFRALTGRAFSRWSV